MAAGPRRRGEARARWASVGLAALLLLVLLTSAGPLPGPTASRPVPAAVPPPIVPLACTGPLALAVNGSPLSGTAPLTVSFSSNVTGGCPPYEIGWEFGDGAEASGASVTHVFSSAGYFHVQAEVSDANDTSREASLTVVVNGGSGALAVVVGASATQGSAPFALTLWANVTGGNVSSALTTSWVFGDGGTGSGSPVAHTYLAPGPFTASATVRDASGQQGTGSLAIDVLPAGVPAAPNLSLSVSPATGGAPLGVTVLAFSNGGAAPYGLTVCFGDGIACATGPVGWTGATPFAFHHTFASPGRFTVTGTLTNATGAAVAGATAAVTVTSTPAVVVEGSLLPGSGTLPLTVELVVTVSGGSPPYAVNWSFGDGRYGSSVPGLMVSHTYTSVGTYTPTVTVSDSAGHQAAASLGPVVVTGPAGLAGLPVAYGGVPTGLLIGLACGLSVVGGYLVGRRNHRRRQQELRKEGEELVRELEQQR